jgi:predicted amidohydrolase
MPGESGPNQIKTEPGMSYLSIAGLQLELGAEDNLSTIEKEIDLVKKRFPWIQMVVLPELCTFGAHKEMAVQLPGEVENCFREAAKRNGFWLVPGSIYERRDGNVFNTAPVINPDGEVIARYRKQYPFYPYEKNVEGSDNFVVFEVPGVGKIGLIICYDVWFPEVIRQLAWMGAEAIIAPTLTNTIDRDVELAISRANAATNQLYFFGLNSAGRLGYGKSIVVGPDGTIIHQASSSREIITVEMDFKHVRRVRERGLHGLGQPLKSFRDANITYPVYQPGAGAGAFAELGTLEVPDREEVTEP